MTLGLKEAMLVLGFLFFLLMQFKAKAFCGVVVFTTRQKAVAHI